MWFIGSVAKARHVLAHEYPTLQFPFENIILVEEDDQGGMLENWIAADILPEIQGIFQSVNGTILEKLLVKTRDGWVTG